MLQAIRSFAKRHSFFSGALTAAILTTFLYAPIIPKAWAACSALTTFTDGQTLTHTHLNNEYGNIYDNFLSCLTPLTGNLDVNSKNLLNVANIDVETAIRDNNSNESLKITATASAVNELTIANAATGSGPTISATGDDTNIAINIAGKGDGKVIFGGTAVASGFKGIIFSETGGSGANPVPSTAANEGAIYTKDVSGATELYYRPQSDGTEVRITSGTALSVTDTNDWVFISSATASASATVDFTTGIDSTYDAYAIVLSGIRPATDDVQLYMRVAVTGTFQSGAADYEYNSIRLLSSGAGAVTSGSGSQGDTEILIAGNSAGANLGSDTSEVLSGQILFYLPSSTTAYKHFIWRVQFFDSSGTPRMDTTIGGGAYNGATSAINGIRFLMSSGNITSGTFYLYGLVKS